MPDEFDKCSCETMEKLKKQHRFVVFILREQFDLSQDE